MELLIERDGPLGLVPRSIRDIINDSIRKGDLTQSHLQRVYDPANRERMHKIKIERSNKTDSQFSTDAWYALTSFFLVRQFLRDAHSDNRSKSKKSTNSAAKTPSKFYQNNLECLASDYIRTWTPKGFKESEAKGYFDCLLWKSPSGHDNYLPLSGIYALCLVEKLLFSLLRNSEDTLSLIAIRESSVRWKCERGVVPKQYDISYVRPFEDKPGPELIYEDSDHHNTFKIFSFSYEGGRALYGYLYRTALEMSDYRACGYVDDPPTITDGFVNHLYAFARVGRTTKAPGSFTTFLAKRSLADLYAPTFRTATVGVNKSAEMTMPVIKGQKFSKFATTNYLWNGLYKMFSTVNGIRTCAECFTPVRRNPERQTFYDLHTRNIAEPLFYSGNTNLQVWDLDVKHARFYFGYSMNTLARALAGWELLQLKDRIFAYRPLRSGELVRQSISDKDPEEVKRAKRKNNFTLQVANELKHVRDMSSLAALAGLFIDKTGGGATLPELTGMVRSANVGDSVIVGDNRQKGPLEQAGAIQNYDSVYRARLRSPSPQNANRVVSKIVNSQHDVY